MPQVKNEVARPERIVIECGDCVCYRCPPSTLICCAKLWARTASGSWADLVAAVTRSSQDGRGVEVPSAA
jgi:hypothetical protein